MLYNFLHQIPIIIYSTAVSQIIEVFLCYLSMTDKHFYQIKKLDKSIDLNKIKAIWRCIKIKLGFFYLFTFIFLVIYWYIISAFCAVYENTQITFIKDSLLSIFIGLIYPLFLYLIPTILRLCAIRNTKMNLKCLYKLSDIIPFF